jgi:4-hydroxy-tetrahydrodipicolinate synthase
MQLHGVLPPLVTPLDADERIDEAGLERQIERMLAGGVHGIYLLGSTGEGPALRDAERRRAIEAARRVLRGRAPLVVGCMASSTARAIDNIRMAEVAGADAVAVTPPHYYPLTAPDLMLEHYRRCAQASGLPLVIYNIPLTTKVMLAPETIMAIRALPRVIGIKDSSGDMTQLVRILALRGDDPSFGVLVGALPISGSALLMGADGIIPGPGNQDPALMVELYERGRAGDVAAVRALQPRLLSLMRVLEFGPGVSCHKAALELMGVCAAHATAPFPRLGDRERAGIAAILREHGLLAAQH